MHSIYRISFRELSQDKMKFGKQTEDVKENSKRQNVSLRKRLKIFVERLKAIRQTVKVERRATKKRPQV